jgi:CO/xanthine dehydrogenase Mo-binding subunit
VNNAKKNHLARELAMKSHRWVSGEVDSCRPGSTTRGGIGEPTICVAAPAVLNAFAKARGKRIRSFPLKNHDIFMG